MVLAFLLACAAAEEEEEAPTLAFLSPEDGEVLTAGDTDVALIVDGFLLVDPSKHGDASTEGWIVARVDGVEAGTFGVTNFVLALAEPGEHTLEAELIHEDGDPLEPPVVASVTVEIE